MSIRRLLQGGSRQVLLGRGGPSASGPVHQYTDVEVHRNGLNHPNLDLRDRRARVLIRGSDVKFRGTHLTFWIRAHDQETDKFVSYSLTSQHLDQYLQDGQWHSVVLDLANDESQWTCLGASESQNSFYGSIPLDRILGNTNDQFGVVLLPVNPDDPPSGMIDINQFVLQYKKPSVI